MSNTVSRVLYQTAIYLALLLPAGSSGLPGTQRATVLFLSGLAPDGVYTAFTVTSKAVSSYLAFSPLPAIGGRLFSVALSWESPPPDVIRHPALRSPDFPHLHNKMQARLSVLLITIQRYFNMMSGKCKDFITAMSAVFFIFTDYFNCL